MRMKKKLDGLIEQVHVKIERKKREGRKKGKRKKEKRKRVSMDQIGVYV